VSLKQQFHLIYVNQNPDTLLCVLSPVRVYLFCYPIHHCSHPISLLSRLNLFQQPFQRSESGANHSVAAHYD